MTGLVSCLLILLPPVLAVLYVRAFGVGVIFSDAWSMAPIFEKWSSGTLLLSDLFAPHNEHRMLFPKGVELLLGSLTNYDNVIEMYLIQACFFVTMVVLFLAFRDNTKSWLFLFVPVAFLVFSFRQYENILFGFQINFAFTQTFGVLALFLLYLVGRGGPGKISFAAALGSGTVASFSTAQGLFVWPAGLLALFLSPVEKRVKRLLLGVWGVAGVAEWVFYFFDFSRSGERTSLLYALYHPLVGGQYFLNLLGSSLFWRENSAFVGGLLLVCLVLVSLFLIYRDRRLGECSFWISLLLYSLLILASITLGRSGVFGALQALAPRYTTFSILAVIAIYAMLAKTAFDRRSRLNTLLLAAVSGIVLLGVAVSYPEGIKVGNKERITREKAAFVLSTYESQPDEAITESLHPRARVVRMRAPVLQELGYNVFSEQQAQELPPLSELSPVPTPTSSSVTIAGDGVSQEGQTVLVSEGSSFVKLTGWAVDDDNESAAGGVYIDVDGRLFPAFYGTERQDVAESLGVPAYRYSGFERALPVSEIGAGPRELSVIVLTADKTGYYRPKGEVPLEVR